MPGIVDVAHRLGLDVPPSDYRHEGAAQGSRAAAAGGVTTILDLPARGAQGMAARLSAHYEYVLELSLVLLSSGQNLIWE